MEAKLQKLKVSDLKELLTKHGLPTSGKKEELIQRLLPVEKDADAEEELLDLPTEQEDASNGVVEPAAAVATETAEVSENAEPVALTPEQEAMRKRAERFGIPYDPNAPAKSATAKSKSKESAPATPAAAASDSTETNTATVSNKKEKISQDGVKSLGISDEKLAARAAKFGPVDVKPAPKDAAVPQEKKEAVSAAAAEAKPAEVDPATAQRVQEEEDKKRKRAEKFGTAAEPADKKAKA